MALALTVRLFCCCCCCDCDVSGRGNDEGTSRDTQGMCVGTSWAIMAWPWPVAPTRTATASSLRTALTPLKTPRVGGTSA